MSTHEKLQYIGGDRRHGSSDEVLTIVDPSTGTALSTCTSATAADVDTAVEAARNAFTAWARTTPAERSDLLLAWADKLQNRSDQLVAMESRNGGKAIRLAAGFDVPGVIDNVVFFAGIARNLEGKASGEYSAGHTSTIRREPVGVVGSISPWNYPLQMAAWKVLPAVASGNTVVLKPSELTPLTSVLFAETATDAGIPPGVINVVTGPGPTTGRALIEHPNVAMVSFTGSTTVGLGVAATAAGKAKRVHLELGGKAPFVVFDDADLDAAVHGAVAGALINAGQDCTAATRAYVQRPLYELFVERVRDMMDKVRLGPTVDPATDMGSLISTTQRDRVAAMVERARGDGAKVVRGGRIPPHLPAAGAYYEPTLITGAAQRSEIVQREVFGPVLVCLPFDTDDQAITLANDTPYGLAASVWSTNVYRTQRASRDIQAGCVWINDHIPIVSEMPHGGYKNSGFGKDMSTYSLDEYTNIKHVMSDITGDARKSWHDVVLSNPASLTT